MTKSTLSGARRGRTAAACTAQNRERRAKQAVGRPSGSENLSIRPARLDDLPALLTLEERAFTTDRLSRRSFRHLLTRANAATLVEGGGGQLRGYAAVLFHRGTSLTRLYSLAVDPQHRGKGIGRALLSAAEDAARERGGAYMRLEVHQNNREATALYGSVGYSAFAIVPRYYEDDADAVRMEKVLTRSASGDDGKQAAIRVPYHEQTLDFTCGPASLMMAMRALDTTIEMSERSELKLWREATTIFMTSGHGGSSPFGLALAAAHRGFDVEVHVTGEGADFFVDSVRNRQKKNVIRLVQQDFIDELRQHGVALHREPLTLAELRTALETGAIPVVLVSTYRLDKKRAPHWVTITGFDDRFVYLNDPFVDRKHDKSRTDCVRVPVPLRDFERMARYGKTRQQAVVLLRKADAR